MKTHRPARMRVLHQVTAGALAASLVALFQGGCSDPPPIGGACNVDADCQSEFQLVPGTVCRTGRCECADPTHHICCARGEHPPDCFLSCRPCEECAVGTQACPSGCQSDAECPGPPDARCGVGRCVSGECTMEAMAGALASQKYGDCQTVYCTPAGESATLEDPSDYFDDGRACTDDRCQGGVPINQPLSAGTPYPGPGETGICYAGERFECIVAVTDACPFPSVCVGPSGNGAGEGGFCVPPTCKNAMPDADEAGVDCGGVCKRPCPNDSPCNDDLDCISGVCAGSPKRCLAPTCFDGRKNDAESGVDCGGASTCGPCAEGRGCAAHTDCASGVCKIGKCQAPSCLDGVQNGDELAVDCGPACGVTCP